MFYTCFGLYSPQKDALFSYLKKSDFSTFLTYPNEFFEIVYLKGRLLASEKTNVEEKHKKLTSYLSLADSWAFTDSILKNVKIKESEYPVWFSYSESLVSRNEEFFVRFGIIVLLNYFLKEEWIESVFSLLSTVKTGAYYVDMAIAWLCATALIRHKERTLRFLRESKNLNKFIVQKSFQKARESFRISPEDKEEYRRYQVLFLKEGRF